MGMETGKRMSKMLRDERLCIRWQRQGLNDASREKNGESGSENRVKVKNPRRLARGKIMPETVMWMK